jgi:hypothetical protein
MYHNAKPDMMDHRTSLADTDFELMFQTNHGRESAAKNK